MSISKKQIKNALTKLRLEDGGIRVNCAGSRRALNHLAGLLMRSTIFQIEREEIVAAANGEGQISEATKDQIFHLHRIAFRRANRSVRDRLRPVLTSWANNRALSWGMTMVAVLVVFCAAVELFGPGAIQLPSKKGSVVCGAGFFYNDKELSNDLSNDLFYQMEEAARQCDSDEPRTSTDIVKGSVLIRGEVCVVNWELTPAAALQAFRSTCLAGENEYM